MSVKNWMPLALLLVSGLFFAGCTKTTEEPAVSSAADSTEAPGEDHVHGEWWCNEHGVPEEICSQCDVSLVADFKAKGDWCEGHDRPDSQCFICHPEKEAEFAAQYEAKYGEQPPKPTAEGEVEEHDHDHEEHKGES